MTKLTGQSVPTSKRKKQETLRSLKVAIDGPAGAGKSTVAQIVAKRLGYLYIDTGAMYRAATWLARKNGIPITDGDAIANAVKTAEIKLAPGDESTGNRVRVFVNGEEVTREIRTREISELVSPVSTHSPVRKVLVARQKELARDGRVVLDGRDIGTVVLPDAQIKIFLDASPEVRARRRMKDLHELGQAADYKTIFKEINERDERDSTRSDSPMKPANDSVQIITDNMTINEVADAITRLCRQD